MQFTTCEIAMRPLLPFVRVVFAAVVCPAVLGSRLVDLAAQGRRVKTLTFEHRLSAVFLLVPADDPDVRSGLEVYRSRVGQREPTAVVLDELASAAWRLAVLAIGVPRGRHVILPCARLALPSW